MANRAPMAPEEWYHCYNRGVDKRKVFEDIADYERLLTLLYVCNGTKNIQIADRYDTSLVGILSDKSIYLGNPIVEIGAYALMPNHPHFIFRQIQDKGISIFMQKVFTGYTMYFNKKYTRTGALFAGTFKSKHVPDDRYLKQLVSYVLLNPVELFEPGWKKGLGNINQIKKQLLVYPYSSFPDFFGTGRPEGKILGSALEKLYDRRPSMKEMLKNAQEYYQEHSPKV